MGTMPYYVQSTWIAAANLGRESFAFSGPIDVSFYMSEESSDAIRRIMEYRLRHYDDGNPKMTDTLFIMIKIYPNIMNSLCRISL